MLLTYNASFSSTVPRFPNHADSSLIPHSGLLLSTRKDARSGTSYLSFTKEEYTVTLSSIRLIHIQNALAKVSPEIDGHFLVSSIVKPSSVGYYQQSCEGYCLVCVKNSLNWTSRQVCR